MLRRNWLILELFIFILIFLPVSIFAVEQPVTIKLGLLENGDWSTIYKNMTSLSKIGLFFTNKTKKQIKEMKISNTGLFDNISWEPYSAIKPWEFSSPDGQKSVYGQFRTDDGEIFSSAATFVYDTTPPDVQFKLITKSVGPDSMFVDYSVEGQDIWSSVNYDCRVGLSSDLKTAIWRLCHSSKVKMNIPVAHYKIYANDFFNVPFLSSKDGQVIKAYFQARDQVFNKTPILSDSFVIDKSPPEVYVYVTPSNSLSSEVEILAYDKYSSLGKMQLSNSPLDSKFHLIGEKIVEMPYKSKIRWNFDKKRIISVRVWDKVGNKSKVYYAYLSPINSPTSTSSEKIIPTKKLLPAELLKPTMDPTIISDPKYIKFQKKIKQLENKQKKLTEKVTNAKKSVQQKKKKISLIEKTLKKIISYLKSIFHFWK